MPPRGFNHSRQYRPDSGRSFADFITDPIINWASGFAGGNNPYNHISPGIKISGGPMTMAEAARDAVRGIKSPTVELERGSSPKGKTAPKARPKPEKNVTATPSAAPTLNMDDPRVKAAVDSMIAGMVNPLMRQGKESRQETQRQVGVLRGTGNELAREQQKIKKQMNQQHAQRAAASKQAMEEASQDWDKTQEAAQNTLRIDKDQAADAAYEGLAQKQRFRDLMRSDAEFATKGSDTMADLVSTSESATRMQTGEDIATAVREGEAERRGLRGQIADARGQRGTLTFQLAQQLFENDLANQKYLAESDAAMADAAADSPAAKLWGDLTKPVNQGNRDVLDDAGEKIGSDTVYQSEADARIMAGDAENIFKQLVAAGYPREVAAQLIRSRAGSGYWRRPAPTGAVGALGAPSIDRGLSAINKMFGPGYFL